MGKYDRLKEEKHVFAAEFSEKDKDSILYLHKNAPNMSKEEWFEFAKDMSPAVQRAILLNQYSPQIVRESILLETTDIRVASCIALPISETVFKALYSAFGTALYHQAMSVIFPIGNNTKLGVKQFCQENINMIAKCIMEGDRAMGYSFKETMSLSINIEDLLHFLKTSPYLTDYLYREIMSNTHIPDHIRNQIINEEIEPYNGIRCDMNRIKNPTREMVEQLYIGAVSVIYEIKNPPEDKVLNAEECLSTLIRNENLTDDLKADLIKRMVSCGSTKLRSFAEPLIDGITDPNLLREASKIKGVDKLSVLYYNRNTPDDVMYDKMFSILKKINKGRESVNDRRIFHIIVHIKPLSKREYQYIFKNLIPKDESTLMNLCRSPYTPASILFDILNLSKIGVIDKDKFENELFIAKMQLKTIENKFPEKYRETITYIANAQITLAEKDARTIIENFPKMAADFQEIFYPKEEEWKPYVDKFNQILKEMQLSEKRPSSQKKINNLIEINKILGEIEKQNSSEKIEDKTTSYLRQRKKELYKEFFKETNDIISLYLMIDDKIDEYNAINEELEKREEKNINHEQEESR